MIINKLVLPINNSTHQGVLEFNMFGEELYATVEVSDIGQIDIDALSQEDILIMIEWLKKCVKPSNTSVLTR
jgi:hypothetical protein